MYQYHMYNTFEMYRKRFPKVRYYTDSTWQTVNFPFCPLCGEGTSRFMIWKEGGLHKCYCRHCGKSATNSFGFCVVFLGETEKKAYKSCHYSKSAYAEQKLLTLSVDGAGKPTKCDPKSIGQNPIWTKKMQVVLDFAQGQFIKNVDNIQDRLFKERGITPETAIKVGLGYMNFRGTTDQRNEGNRTKRKRTDFGIPVEDDEPDFFYFYTGLYIPIFRNNEVYGLICRPIPRFDPKKKMINIKGSKAVPSFYGDDCTNVVATESDLDAILMYQENGYKNCFCAYHGKEQIGLGDNYSKNIIRNAEKVIFIPDDDTYKKDNPKTRIYVETEAYKYAEKLGKERTGKSVDIVYPKGAKDCGDMYKSGTSVALWYKKEIFPLFDRSKCISIADAQLTHSPIFQEPLSVDNVLERLRLAGLSVSLERTDALLADAV